MTRATRAVLLQLIILTVFWSNVFGETLVLRDVRPCDNGDLSQVREIRVTPCNKEPCAIPKGEVVRMEVDFIANRNSVHPQVSIKAKLLGFLLPFPSLNPNGCVGKNLQCPLEKGKLYTFKYDLKVEKYFPRVTVDARWKLKGETGGFFCFLAPVSVV
ncbi:epididymal secretory protein E1-like [Limulus polyphemus]|uniref:Epididymal secretory protein E1-like n=1 Tax=Limulus polyphemus TaxID=6850 RepID=A0ABM1C2M6_LIMPO|nr:epididymal secretory protein E1-like [Limulus polyphemus]